MKRSSAFVSAWIFIFATIAGVPAVSFADTSIKGKADCPAGSSTGDPSGSKDFYGTGSASAIQSYIYSAESCASACFDERLSVSVGYISVTVAVKGTNKCNATPVDQPQKATPPRGCMAGETQPLITIDVPELKTSEGTVYVQKQTIGPKSRCYEAVKSTLDTLMKGGISGTSNAAAIQANFDSLKSLGTQAPVIRTDSAIAGNDQLISALTTSGIRADDAKKLAADPASAQALINAYASGNKDTIQDTVQDAAKKANIPLTDAIYTNIASLSDSKVERAKTDLAPLADASGTAIPGDTFAQPPALVATPSGASLTDGTVCGFPGIGGMIMNPETLCGSVQAPAGQSAQGPLQYQCATWQAYTSATGHSDWGDCSNRYDATKAVQVTNDYYQNIWLPQNSAACAAANISLPSCAYTSHWLGVGGGPSLVKALPGLDTSAPVTSLCGSAMLSQAACDQNPGLIYADSKNRSRPYTIAGVFQHMDSLLGVKGTSPATFAGQSSGGPFSSITGGGSTIPLENLSSPFANVSGIYTTSGLGGNPYYTQTSYGGYQTQTYNPYSPTSAPRYPAYVPVQTGVQNPAVAPAVAQLVVQPHSAAVGAQLSVAWTSAGTDPTSPCRVLENGSMVIASASEGVRLIAATSTGTVSFTLTCRSLGTGAVVTSSDSATVR